MSSEYPKAMSHPQFRAAILSKDEIGPNGQIIKAAPGKPAQFPPVYVNNVDQEQMYAARGYVPNGNYDPEAYKSQMTVAVQGGYVHSEFPKYLYTKDENGDMDVLSDQGEYVKVRSILVKDQEQQDKLVGAWYATHGDAANGDPDAEAEEDASKDGDEEQGQTGEDQPAAGRNKRRG